MLTLLTTASENPCSARGFDRCQHRRGLLTTADNGPAAWRSRAFQGVPGRGGRAGRDGLSPAIGDLTRVREEGGRDAL